MKTIPLTHFVAQNIRFDSILTNWNWLHKMCDWFMDVQVKKHFKFTWQLITQLKSIFYFISKICKILALEDCLSQVTSLNHVEVSCTQAALPTWLHLFYQSNLQLRVFFCDLKIFFNFFLIFLDFLIFLFINLYIFFRATTNILTPLRYTITLRNYDFTFDQKEKKHKNIYTCLSPLLF